PCAPSTPAGIGSWRRDFRWSRTVRFGLERTDLDWGSLFYQGSPSAPMPSSASPGPPDGRRGPDPREVRASVLYGSAWGLERPTPRPLGGKRRATFQLDSGLATR